MPNKNEVEDFIKTVIAIKAKTYLDIEYKKNDQMEKNRAEIFGLMDEVIWLLQDAEPGFYTMDEGFNELSQLLATYGYQLHHLYRIADKYVRSNPS
jgi:hypothetical protein